jgi:hypothetical protein
MASLIRHPDARHHRAREHRGAGPALQRRDPGLQHEHRAVEVGAHYLAVGVGAGAVQRRDQRAAHAVRQQRRCGTQRFLAGRDGQRGAFGRGGVGGNAHGCFHVGQAAGVAPHRGDAAALGMQLASQGAADAAAGTGDEGNRCHGVCS